MSRIRYAPRAIRTKNCLSCEPTVCRADIIIPFGDGDDGRSGMCGGYATRAVSKREKSIFEKPVREKCCRRVNSEK